MKLPYHVITGRSVFNTPTQQETMLRGDGTVPFLFPRTNSTCVMENMYLNPATMIRQTEGEVRVREAELEPRLVINDHEMQSNT